MTTLVMKPNRDGHQDANYNITVMVHNWIVYLLHHFLLSVCAFETVNRSSYSRNTFLRNKNIELVRQKRRHYSCHHH